MAKVSLPQGEDVQCKIASCLRFLHDVTESISSMVVSEITLSITNWSGGASHHTELGIHCMFLNKDFPVASCSTWYPVTFLFWLCECSHIHKRIQRVHGLIKYFLQVTTTELLDCLKNAKLGENMLSCTSKSWMFLSSSLRVAGMTLRVATPAAANSEWNYSGLLMLVAILPLHLLIFLCVCSFST